MHCKKTDCTAEWDEQNPSCLCGEMDYKICKYYLGNAHLEINTAAEENSYSATDTVTLPIAWTGDAMGIVDMEWICNKRQAFVIGVIGTVASGKTTLLATLYMLLRSGKSIGNYRFAGSYTLLGWEKIAHFLTFNEHKHLFFPPHTSSKSLRVPSLLHLLLKDSDGRYHDLLFTDAPGEWFSDWAISANSEESKGARWIDECADAFVLIADSQAFKDNIGKARRELTVIAERMKNTHLQRPTALTWTKTDVSIDTTIKQRLTDKVKVNLPNLKPFDVAVVNHNDNEPYLNNVLRLIEHLLLEKHQYSNQLPPITITQPNDFFLSIRQV